MAKTKQQKQKDREKRVAKEKLASTARRREIAKKTDEKPVGGVPRAKKVMTEGVKQKSQVQSAKPNVTHRRAGGG